MAHRRETVLRGKNAFGGCKFCHGSGCLACSGERQKYEAARQKEYERLYPNGPEPIISVTTEEMENPEVAEILRKAISADAIREAYSREGLTEDQFLERLFSGDFGDAKVRKNLETARTELEEWRARQKPAESTAQ